MRNRGHILQASSKIALLACLASLLLLTACGGSAKNSQGATQVATNTPTPTHTPTQGATPMTTSSSYHSFEFPKIEGAAGAAPTIIAPKGTPPSTLEIKDLVTGAGAVVQPTSTVTVHYLLMAWKTGEIIDSSWSRGAPSTFGLNQVIPGWQQGMPGMKIGGRRELLIPPALGYGDLGSGPVGPKETLIFVVDLIALK